MTRDSTAVSGTPFLYYYYNGNEQTITPVAKKGRERSDFALMRKRVAEAVKFDGNIEVVVPQVVAGKVVSMRVGSKARKHFGHWREAPGALSLWKGVGASGDAPYGDREIKDAACRRLVAELGLRIPQDYVLTSRGRMMVTSCHFADGKVVKEVRSCEGETLIYVRRFNGRDMLSERCVVAVGSSGLIHFSIRQQPIDKGRRVKARGIQIARSDATADTDGLQAELVYVLRKGKFMPVWKVGSRKRAFLYDALTGGELE